MHSDTQVDAGLVEVRRKFEFAIFYTPGPQYVPALSETQQKLASHRAHIEDLRGQMKLIQGGPFPDNWRGTDPRHGTPILSVVSEAEAQSLIAADPAVASGVLQAQLMPWHIRFGVNIPKF
jgi:uncharacterized protein YciI